MKKSGWMILFLLLGGLASTAWLSGQEAQGRKVEPLVFRSHSVVDQQFLGMEVFRMLVTGTGNLKGE